MQRDGRAPSRLCAARVGTQHIGWLCCSLVKADGSGRSRWFLTPQACSGAIGRRANDHRGGHRAPQMAVTRPGHLGVRACCGMNNSSWARGVLLCHGRAWSHHPRLYCLHQSKTWMAGLRRPRRRRVPLAGRYREAGNAASIRHWCRREDACLEDDDACERHQDEPDHENAGGFRTIG
jgi:hypothetical protein